MTITDSTTVLPSNFLPALRPGDTSVIDFGLYTTDAGGKWGVWYSDIVLVAPVATPTTATTTVTETSVFTVAASASATPSESESETAVQTDTTGLDEELGSTPMLRRIPTATVAAMVSQPMPKPVKALELVQAHFLSLSLAGSGSSDVGGR
jgi:hypothetical protein